jgi:hypothetical protein
LAWLRKAPLSIFKKTVGVIVVCSLFSGRKEERVHHVIVSVDILSKWRGGEEEEMC